MNRPLDITGRRYGMLVVVGPFETRPSGRYWRVQCDCKSEPKFVSFNNLRSKSVLSCGCQQNKPKHGMSKTALYAVWSQMIERCRNRNHESYHRYGGRGIKVCDRWLESVEAFIADMGPRPEGHWVERVDNDGDYCPDNCVWATRKQQARNRSDNKRVNYEGRLMTLSEASELSGLRYDTIKYRIDNNWPNPFQKTLHAKE